MLVYSTRVVYEGVCTRGCLCVYLGQSLTK